MTIYHKSLDFSMVSHRAVLGVVLFILYTKPLAHLVQSFH